jgi:nucleotide-binding universal stress UspA family protein
MAAIRLLTEFLSPFDAEIEVLHVNTSKYQSDEKEFRDYSESVRKTFVNNKFIFRSVHLHHPAEVIELIASMDHADLIVLTKPHRGYWSELFHKSIVTEKIRKSSFPLLIIH